MLKIDCLAYLIFQLLREQGISGVGDNCGPDKQWTGHCGPDNCGPVRQLWSGQLVVRPLWPVCGLLFKIVEMTYSVVSTYIAVPRQ